MCRCCPVRFMGVQSSTSARPSLKGSGTYSASLGPLSARAKALLFQLGLPEPAPQTLRSESVATDVRALPAGRKVSLRGTSMPNEGPACNELRRVSAVCQDLQNFNHQFSSRFLQCGDRHATSPPQFTPNAEFPALVCCYFYFYLSL